MKDSQSFGSSSDPISQLNESSGSFVPQFPQAPRVPVTSGGESFPGSAGGFSQFGNPMSGPGGNLPPSPFMPQGPQVPPAPPMVPTGGLVGAPTVVPMGTVSSDLNISKIHAFAGNGIPITNHSWYIRESGGAAGKMLTTAFDIFHRRGILQLTVEPKNLQDYGDWNEIRHYLILRRGIARIFLYIAPVGHDLYISRTTTVLTSIDPSRRFLLIASAIIAVLCTLLFIFIFVAIPFWLGLIVFFAISFRYWLTERDFWYYLRKRDLNDFQVDDISMMEEMTDETLRVAAKQNEVDADQLKSPATKHGRRVRAV